MKLVQRLLFSFLLVACQYFPANSQEKNKTLIGLLEGGQPRFTVDQSDLISVYKANLLKFSNIDADFTDVDIVIAPDKQYLLVFRSALYKSSFAVTSADSKLYAINNVSCTTSECSSEKMACSPKTGEPVCSPCSNNGKCTKTVSSVSLIE